MAIRETTSLLEPYSGSSSEGLSEMECQSEENGKWDQVCEKPLDAALLENRLIGVVCHRHLLSLNIPTLKGFVNGY